MFPLFHLYLYRLLFGELSERYYSLVQRYRKQYPKLNVMVKKCLTSEPVLQFDNLILRNPRFPVFKTDQTILFEQLPFSSTLKDIEKRNGYFTCVNYFEVGESQFRTIGYRDHMLNISVMLLYFLCEDHFFMGEYMFSSHYQTISPKLAAALFEKYGVANPGSVNQFYIEDANGSLLCFYEDGFCLRVKYFNEKACTAFNSLRDLFEKSSHFTSPRDTPKDGLLSGRL